MYFCVFSCTVIAKYGHPMIFDFKCNETGFNSGFFLTKFQKLEEKKTSRPQKTQAKFCPKTHDTTHGAFPHFQPTETPKYR